MKMKKYSSKIKKYVIMVIIVYFMIMLIATVISITDSKKIQLMNKLDFDISLNEDGSMNVTETWDIYVKNTGTLFKDFYETDRYPITDVAVKNLDTNTDFANVGEVIYDVPNGMYYAESIDNYGTDEIAFGTGMEQSSGNQRYQISYKISNVINTYVDCQEFYWKFLDESNNVPCKEITGKIKLPDSIKNPENLKAWGHGNLKGEINIPSSNEVDFKVENLNAENMLEIRIMTTDKIFNTSELSDEFYDSDSILVEEKKWANQTNRKIILLRIFVILLLLIYVLLIIYFISKIYRFLKALCKNDTKISNEKIKYFRDIPREKSATPGEAEYLYFFKKNIEIDDVNQSNLLASYILDLCQKRYISIEKKKENLYISIIKNSDGLKSDEKEIYQLLEQAMDLNNKKTIEVKKLKEFAKSDDFKVSLLPRTEDADDRYSNPDNDPRGDWKGASFLNPATPEQRPNLCYPITNPNTGEVTMPTTNAWRREKKVYEQLLVENRLYWGVDGMAKVPSVKMFLSEARGLTPINFWSHNYAGNTDNGTDELFSLLGAKVFEFPKPSLLVQRVLEHLNDKDFIVLDFFGGSGTTGHAVVNQNMKDGGHRKYILVQIPEKTGENSNARRAGFNTISEITMARNKAVCEKVRKSYEGKLITPEDQEQLDRFGFKVFTLSKSSFPRVDFAPDPYASDEENMRRLQDYIYEKESQLNLAFNEEELLTEILIKQGFMLTYKLELQPQFTDNNVYWATDGEREAYITVDTLLAGKTVDYFLTHTDKKFICIERALDTTKKFNLKKAMDMKFFAF